MHVNELDIGAQGCRKEGRQMEIQHDGETNIKFFVWTVFNQKTLYNAYKKRTNNIQVDMEEYNKMKEADPEFYREASSLQYGKVNILVEDLDLSG